MSEQNPDSDSRIDSTTRRGALAALAGGGVLAALSGDAQAQIGGGPDGDELSHLLSRTYVGDESDLPDPGVEDRFFLVLTGGSTYSSGDLLRDTGSSWQLVDLNLGSLGVDRATIRPTLSDTGPVAFIGGSELSRAHDVRTKDGIAVIATKDGVAASANIYPRDDPKGLTGSISSLSDAQAVAAPPNDWPPYCWFVGESDNLHAVAVVQQGGVIDIASTATFSGSAINGLDWYHADPASGNSYLYAALKSGPVGAVNVSDFDAPTIVNEYAGHSVNSPHDVATCANGLITVNQQDGATPKVSFVKTVSATSTEIKSSGWSQEDTVSDSQLNGANRVKRLGQEYYLVACNIANNLAAVKFSTTNNGMTVQDVVSTGSSDGPSGLEVIGDDYAVTSGVDRTQIWDVSDPDNIQKVDEYIFASSIGGNNLSVDGRWLYQIDATTGGVHVWDLGYAHGRSQEPLFASAGEG